MLKNKNNSIENKQYHNKNTANNDAGDGASAQMDTGARSDVEFRNGVCGSGGKLI